MNRTSSCAGVNVHVHVLAFARWIPEEKPLPKARSRTGTGSAK